MIMARFNRNLLFFCVLVQCALILSQIIEDNSTLEQQDVFSESSGMGEDLRSPSEFNTTEDDDFTSPTTTAATCVGVFIRPALSCPTCNTDLDCNEGQSCCPMWFPRKLKCCGNRIRSG
uniref:WAP domain-containing protein n=1 Tax=Strigamia maritima TaxID=126957 RepID=T1IHW4_STRMM